MTDGNPTYLSPPNDRSPAAASLWVKLTLLGICLFALWLRAPRVGEGMPFFYREDEAHHFNRLAEMVKSGSLDPLYFHKPSLHFYLRMPVFGASFLWAVKHGALRSVQEVTTRDPYGVGDYAFSASHPGIVKWSRALTAALGLLLIPLAYLLGRHVGLTREGALIAAAAVAVSPPLIEEGAVIGVDILMAALCMTGVWCAVNLLHRCTITKLWVCGLVCGLAISSKYNAAPIAALPLIAVVCAGKREWTWLAVAMLSPIIGFSVATPYLFVHIPLFLDHVAYEIWHYGVAGHVGYMAEPGWQQFLFYVRWLNFEALGPVLTALGLLGWALLFSSRTKHTAFVFLAFPFLFGALMVAQKTNFTRNMLVIIPFIAIIGAHAFMKSLQALHLEGVARRVAVAVFILIGLGYPLRHALLQRAEATSFVDSRTILTQQLIAAAASATSPPKEQVAIAGQLQVPQQLFSSGPFARFDQLRRSPLELYMRGFDSIAIGPAWDPPNTAHELFSVSAEIPGDPDRQRIVKSPRIQVLRAIPSEQLSTSLSKLALADRELQLDVQLAPPPGTTKACSVAGGLSPASASETYCWAQGRTVFLKFLDLDAALRASPSSPKITLYLDAMTPWRGNPITFVVGDWRQTIELSPGVWTSFSLQPPLAALRSTGGVFVEVATVRSPKLQGLSADDRNLGVALQRIRLDAPPSRAP